MPIKFEHNRTQRLNTIIFTHISSSLTGKINQDILKRVMLYIYMTQDSNDL